LGKLQTIISTRVVLAIVRQQQRFSAAMVFLEPQLSPRKELHRS